MLKWLVRVVLLVAIVVAGVVSYAYVQIRSLQTEQITQDLYMLKGVGGNVGVLRTGDGAVIVDSMTFEMQGARIKQVAEELTGQPVVMIINTQYHLDHTHGNPAFDAGTRVVATEKTLHYLKKLDAATWEGDAAALLPNETFTDALDLTIGGKTIRLFHPGRGHTDGDLVVLFVDEDTIHMGDLLFHKHYPNIDLEAGGTIAEWSATLDAAMELPFTKVIPGHGDITDRDGIRQYQTFIEQLAEVGRTAVANGWSEEETQEKAELTADADYEEIAFVGLPIGLDRRFVIRRAWEEATGNFERVDYSVSR